MNLPSVLAGRPGPVLVIGMHRSGTRLLTDVLDRLGVFMGGDRQADDESVTFMMLNEMILHQCGAFWNEPMAAHFVLADPDTVAAVGESVREALDRQIDSYAGAGGSAIDAAAYFGWKDPRNTFTLAVWRYLFPDLRVIHVMRHGVDVAASLARRHAAALRSATGETIPRALTVIRDDAFGILSSRRGWTLSEALSLWEEYVEKARQHAAELRANLLEIRFEDLLEDPRRLVAEIAGFLDLPAFACDPQFLDRLDARRSHAFRRDSELARFAGSVATILERYGYAP